MFLFFYFPVKSQHTPQRCFSCHSECGLCPLPSLSCCPAWFPLCAHQSPHSCPCLSPHGSWLQKWDWACSVGLLLCCDLILTNYIRNSLFPNGHILMYWALGLHHMNLGTQLSSQHKASGVMCVKCSVHESQDTALRQCGGHPQPRRDKLSRAEASPGTHYLLLCLVTYLCNFECVFLFFSFSSSPVLN